MKAATIILALAGAVMAQNFEGQPACAVSSLHQKDHQLQSLLSPPFSTGNFEKLIVFSTSKQTDCLISAISAAGCAATDVACQCGPTQTAIGAAAAPCLLKACTQPSDLIQAQSAGAAQCSKFSATATKTEDTSKTTAATGSSTAAPTSNGAGPTTTEAPTTTGTVTPQTTTSGNAAAGTPIAMGLAALLGAVAAL